MFNWNKDDDNPFGSTEANVELEPNGPVLNPVSATVVTSTISTHTTEAEDSGMADPFADASGSGDRDWADSGYGDGGNAHDQYGAPPSVPDDQDGMADPFGPYPEQHEALPHPSDVDEPGHPPHTANDPAADAGTDGPGQPAQQQPHSPTPQPGNPPPQAPAPEPQPPTGPGAPNPSHPPGSPAPNPNAATPNQQPTPPATTPHRGPARTPARPGPPTRPRPVPTAPSAASRRTPGLPDPRQAAQNAAQVAKDRAKEAVKKAVKNKVKGSVAVASAPVLGKALIIFLIIMAIFGAIGFVSMSLKEPYWLPPAPDAYERMLTPPTVDDEEEDFLTPLEITREIAESTEQPTSWADIAYLGQSATEGEPNFGVPWPILTGLARAQSDFGRRSPYDSVDRYPFRNAAYGLGPDTGGSAGVGAPGPAYTGPVHLIGASYAEGLAGHLAGTTSNQITTRSIEKPTIERVTDALRKSKELPDVVVPILGPGESTNLNHSDLSKKFTQLYRATPSGTRLIIPTFHDPKHPGFAVTFNKAMKAAAKKADHVTVVEFAQAARGKKNWFNDNGTFTTAGVQALARHVKKAVKQAPAHSGWVMPLPDGTYRWGRPYKARGNLWASKVHTGQDFPAPNGTPVFAAHGGTVSMPSKSWAGPHFVAVTNPDGIATWYGHMSAANVSPGQVVATGQQIGKVGSLGNSTGPHLHFEVWINGGNTMVNPVDYLPKRGNTVSTTDGQFPVSDLDCPVHPGGVPIGGGPDEGVGPFLLLPHRAAEMIDQGLNPQNACDSVRWVAEQLYETGVEVLEEGDFEDHQDDPDQTRKMWGTIISSADLFADPSSGQVGCLYPADRPDQVAVAIELTMRCEAAKVDRLHTVTEATTGPDGKVEFRTVEDDTALDMLVREAQQVAAAWRRHRPGACDNTAPRAGVLPLTKEVAAKYELTDRCEPAENIRAATRALLDGETVPVDDRSTAKGMYQPAAGGWAALNWALGKDAAQFYRNGPHQPWSPTAKCETRAQAVVKSALTNHSALLDTGPEGATDPAAQQEWDQALGHFFATPPPACAGATVSDWAGLISTITTGDGEGNVAWLGGLDFAPLRMRALNSYAASKIVDTKLPAVRIGADSLIARLSADALDHTKLEGAVTTGFGAREVFPLAEIAFEYAVQYGRITEKVGKPKKSVLQGVGATAVSGLGAGADVKTVIAAARSQIGLPYSWGGGGPNGPSKGIDHGANIFGFDCSGLTEYAFAKAGYQIGTTSRIQVTKGTPVKGGLANAIPGDLLFWGDTKASVYHVAIYLGNNRMLEAPRTGLNVRETAVYGKVTFVQRIIQPTAGGSWVSSGDTPAQLRTGLAQMGGEPYAALFVTAGEKHKLPAALLAAVAYQESTFRADVINCTRGSSAGAQGMMQFMPGTARDLNADPCNPASAVDAAARYLSQQLSDFGSVDKALAAYNWGPSNVRNKGMAAMPRETQKYVTQVPETCRRLGGCRIS